MKSVLMTLILTLSVGDSLAESYWVVGSLVGQEAVEREANRLAMLTGVPISVSAFNFNQVAYVRLLMPEDVLDEGLNEQLRQEGISPWLVTLENRQVKPFEMQRDMRPVSLQEPIAAGMRFFYVAASYRDVEDAMLAEEKLSGIFSGVRGQSALVRGHVYHRVLVGPLSRSEVDVTRQDLTDNGFPHAWRINAGDQFPPETAIEANVSSQVTITLDEVKQLPVSKHQVLSEVTRNIGFNLARLPERSRYFLNPQLSEE